MWVCRTQVRCALAGAGTIVWNRLPLRCLLAHTARRAGARCVRQRTDAGTVLA